MLSMYRQGRQTDALAAYRRGRRQLIDDMGLEPGLDLQRMERAILANDPLLTAAASESAIAPFGQPSPALSEQPQRHNLPVELTSFVGRAAEVAQVIALLAGGRRLVTVTGVGGDGKTRLARRAAAAMVDDLPDGAWMVDLTAVLSGDRIIEAVAAVLGVSEQPGRPVFESTVGYLRERRLLLVFDNCEPLIWECARLCEALLQGAPGLSILATSREPMRIGAETIWQLPPLTTADEAVSLFVERGRAVAPQLVLTDEDLRDAVTIAERLDGLPLAIEMAAARLPALTPREIADRLDDRFRLLSGPRTAEPRHRTLLATVDWSHDLLKQPEQILWRRMAVFAGRVQLQAIEQVCSSDPIEPRDVAGLVAELVERSLLSVVQLGDGITRFALLDTVKEYGRVKLREAGEEALLLSQHLDWCTDAATTAHRTYLGREAEAVAALTAALDELRAALDRAPALDPARELELAGLLGWFWPATGRLAEGERQCAHALECQGAPVDRARVLTARGSIAAPMGEHTRATEHLEAALSTWRVLGDRREECITLDALGWAYFWAGANEPSLKAFRAGTQLAQDLDSAELLLRHMAGECQLLVADGNVTQGRPLAERLIALAASEDVRTAHYGHHFLADFCLIEGNFTSAADEYGRAFVCAQTMDDPIEASFEVQGLAMAHAGLGNARTALMLGGAAEAALDARQVDIAVPFWARLLDHWLGLGRTQAGPRADAFWREGRTLALDEAVGRAQAITRS